MSADLPRRRIELEAARVGRPVLVGRCVALLRGETADPDLLRLLAGRAASWGHVAGPDQQYWWRVWALRGLLWAWDEAATEAVRAACADEQWRVREMAAKVVARHRVDPALTEVSLLRRDESPRVRAAADRAVVALTVGCG